MKRHRKKSRAGKKSRHSRKHSIRHSTKHSRAAPKPAGLKPAEQQKRAILIIMDGWGIRASKKANAVKLAKTPNLTALSKRYPYAVLGASGPSVGLPKGQMGNSEVGHMNIGAGRIVGQELAVISKAIRNGSFFRNKALAEAFKKARNIHLMGLVSDGGIHSHIDHLLALIRMAKKHRKRVYIHAFLDGRDTEKKCAEKFLLKVQKSLKGIGEIATISGRYYAMDRDERWDRVEKAYNCISGIYSIYSDDPLAALKDAYAKGETDEFITPTITSAHYRGMGDGDSIIFFNFREDRARQLTRAFVDDSFTNFSRSRKKIDFVCMTRYDNSIKNVSVAFEQQHPGNVLGEVLSKAGKKQLRVAETEKFVHITYFTDCGSERGFPGEDRVHVPSPKVATYDLKPEMSAAEAKDEVLKGIRSGNYNFIAINFANGDMVGHTGILEAAKKAVEAVDRCIGEIVKEAFAKGYPIIITADHGNCEEMAGKHQTTHTTNPVPFILVSGKKHKLKRKGVLGNIAPTVLQLMGIQRPKEMMRGLIIS